MIVFPMAGLSSRFLSAGYTQPKFMLPLWGETVFDHAVDSFRPCFGSEPFVFIYRETGGVRDFIDARLRSRGVASATLVKLERETAGQAETVELGLNDASVETGAPVTIFNIDTFRRPSLGLVEPAAALGGWLEVFSGTGENWSFVRPAAEPGIALETAEKKPISDLCCTGLYHFAARRLFDAALAEERRAPQAPELYVAPIYNHLIRSGERIGYSVVETNDIVFCGIPAEYQALDSGQSAWDDT
jgi:hypothetical protein